MTNSIKWLADVGKIVRWAGANHVVYLSTEFELVLCPNPHICGKVHHHSHWTVKRWYFELVERLHSK